MENLPSTSEKDFDVVLVCDDSKFKCNRRMLAKHSPYFNAMFSCDMRESRSHEITIQDTHPSALKELIDFSYTNKFLANENNVFIVLEAATMFQFDAIQAACMDFLKANLKSTNCLSIMCFADSLGLIDLLNKARHLALWSFDQIKDDSEILELSSNGLVNLISHDGLHLKEEMNVFNCMMRWIEYDLENRSHELYDLLQCIRFKNITLQELSTMMKNKIVLKNAKVQELLRKIQMLKLNPSFSSVENEMKDIHYSQHADLETIVTRLLSLPRRSIPTVPVIVGQMIGENGDKTSDSQVIYYNSKRKNFCPVMNLKKIWANSSVAVGYRVCAVGQNIYVTGGEVMLGYSNWNLALWSYNIFQENWTFCCNLPQPRRHHSTCVLGNDIYIIGGIGRYRVILSNVDRYNTKTGEWTNLQPLPDAVYSVTCTVHQNSVFVLTSKVYRYSPKDNVWITNHVQLPNEHGFHTALSHTNGIYLISRHSRDLILYLTNSQNDATAYKIIGQFSSLSENACIVENLIYSFSANNCCEVEVYDIANNTFYIDAKSTWAAKVNYGSFVIPHYS